MKIFIIAIALSLIYIYVLNICKINPRFDIIQGKLSDISIKHLFERSPIVIEDRIVYPESLLHTLFKYMYVNKKITTSISSSVLKPNRYAYTIIHAKGKVMIKISHANDFKKKGNDSFLVNVPLDKGQCIVLPHKWAYSISNNGATIIELSSIRSILCNLIA